MTVKVGGRIVAQSDDALLLREASYPPEIYIPREDAKMEPLERTTNSSYCPYKGEASYYSIPIGGERSGNAIWT